MEFWRLTNSTDESVQIDVYGDIGTDTWSDEESVGAKAFLDAVRDAKGKAIDLHVNSGGGSVFDAFAMMTALANHDGKVTAHVDGIAASAASFLLAAADEVRMSSAAFIMIHDASTVAWGNASQIRETAEWLDMIDGQLAGIYAKRGAKSAEEFKAAMDETTWLDAENAVEWGLADYIDEAVAAAACVTADKRVLETAPEAANILRLTVTDTTETATEPEQGEVTITASTDMSDESEPQEQPVAQERVVAIDGCVYRFRAESTD